MDRLFKIGLVFLDTTTWTPQSGNSPERIMSVPPGSSQQKNWSGQQKLLVRTTTLFTSY